MALVAYLGNSLAHSPTFARSHPVWSEGMWRERVCMCGQMIIPSAQALMIYIRHNERVIKSIVAAATLTDSSRRIRICVDKREIWSYADKDEQ